MSTATVSRITTPNGTPSTHEGIGYEITLSIDIPNSVSTAEGVYQYLLSRVKTLGAPFVVQLYAAMDDTALQAKIDDLDALAVSEAANANDLETYYHLLSRKDHFQKLKDDFHEVGELYLDTVAGTRDPADPDVTGPAAPTGLAPTAGDGQVTLNWTANTDSDFHSYRIYRGTSASPTVQLVKLVGIGTTSYIDTTAVNGTTYYYRMRAVDKAANPSSYTADVSATPSA